MASGLLEAIRLIVQEKGISEDLVIKTIEDFLMAAYKRKYGTTENAVFQYDEEKGEVAILARKKIVEEIEDPVTEIELEDALAYDESCEIGDELLIEIDPREFDRVAVQSAKQKARQSLREIHKDTLYAEFHGKVGEMIIGYFQREHKGNIIVDLGRAEGIMPKRYQSPRETYRANDRIKAMIYEVNKTPMGLQIVLTRTHVEFVKKIFELEVPEIYDKTVEIMKIVREPGYRTKIAVWSHRDDVDPVGACVGLKGVRIQAIVRELEGEKIDILNIDNDPRSFIRNALSPAEVNQFIILDEGKRMALAVVDESQLSLAIGKQGLNVRLANRLVDWNIDVKTEQQFAEMDISVEKKMAVRALFGDYDEEEEEISRIAELPDIPAALVKKLADDNIELIEELVSLTREEIGRLNGLEPDEVKLLGEIIANNVKIIEQQSGQSQPELEAEAKEEYYDGAGGEGEYAEDSDEEEEITLISELPGIPEHIIEVLTKAGIVEIVDLISLNQPQLKAIPGLSAQDIEVLLQTIQDTVEIIEED